MSIATRPAFDLSSLPGFISVGLVPLDEIPAYQPTPEDDAYRLGFELELAGEPAMLKDRSYGPEQQLRFALGQRAARQAAEPGPIKPRPLTSAELVDGLLMAAAHCDREGGPLGDFLARLIRDAAGDCEVFSARSWNEYDGRRQVMLDSLSYCHECATRNHDDKR